MKHFTKFLFLFALLLLLFMTAPGGTASAAADSSEAENTAVANGLIKENGTYHFYENGVRLKKSWKTVGKYKYYFDKNGNAVTLAQKIDGKRYVFDEDGRLKCPSKNKVVKIGSNKYYVSTKGRAKSGWIVQDGKLYYAKRTGKCLKSTTYRDIKFTKNSYAKTSDYATKAKIKAMKIIAKITDSSMTKKQKLRTCFDYTMSCTFVGSSYPDGWPNKMKKGWYYKAAYKMMTKRKGNCYGYASMFALLARELGYTPTIIDAVFSGRHCIVKINNKYYDNTGSLYAVPAKKYKSYTTKNKWTLKP